MSFKKITYWALTIILFFSFNEMKSQDQKSKLNELRAFFIYTISSYIEWPDNADDYLVIGIINNHELEEPLDKIAKKKKVNNKRLIVKKFATYEGIEKCHILIIPESEKENLKKIMHRIEGYSVLTVGYGEGFSSKGICVNLINLDGKIAFEVNKKSLEKYKLKASSQMLKLAKNIY